MNPIQCIAIPTTPGEVGDLAVLFFIWSLYHERRCLADALFITLPGSRDPDLHANILRLVQIFGVDRLFSEVKISFLEIAASDNIYIRHGVQWDKEIPRYGLKSGPNLQFFRTIEAASQYGFIFLNETDVFPLDPTWFLRLNSSIRQEEDWVVGSTYRGSVKIAGDIADHINGAAVYATGNKDFQLFASEMWEPKLVEMCQSQPDTAYDIWLARYRYLLANSPEAWAELSNQQYKSFVDAASRFKSTVCIANLSLPVDKISVDELLCSGVVLVHGKHYQVPALDHALMVASHDTQRHAKCVEALSVLVRQKKTAELPLTLAKCLSNSMIAESIYNIAQRRLFSQRAESRLPSKHIEPYAPDDLPLTRWHSPNICMPLSSSDICIYTRSYIGDMRFLPKLYESIEKYFPMAGEAVLVLEEQDVDQVASVVPSWVRIVSEQSFAHGTIQHKYSKLVADTHTQKSWIFHIDSDTTLTSEIALNYLFNDAKSIIEIASYDSLRTHQDSAEFRSTMETYVKEYHLTSALDAALEVSLKGELHKALASELHAIGVSDIDNWFNQHYDKWLEVNFLNWHAEWMATYYDSWKADWLSREFPSWFNDWFKKWKYSFGLDVWQEGTSFAFGKPIYLEYSQKPIKVYPREVYSVCRDHIYKVHGLSLADFIATRVGKQSYGIKRDMYFSDLNFIGACLYNYYHDYIYWVRTDIEGFDYRESRVKQLISYDIISLEDSSPCL